VYTRVCRCAECTHLCVCTCAECAHVCRCAECTRVCRCDECAHVCVGVMSVHTFVCIGVPTLVLVDEENKTISQNARFVVSNDVEGKV